MMRSTVPWQPDTRGAAAQLGQPKADRHTSSWQYYTYRTRFDKAELAAIVKEPTRSSSTSFWPFSRVPSAEHAMHVRISKGPCLSSAEVIDRRRRL